MEGGWATIFICHLIFGGHLLNIPGYVTNNKKPFGNTSKWLFVSLNRGNRLDSLFFDSCFLSSKSTQVIQFCATNTTHLVNRNIFDKRRFDRENSFYADVV